MKMTLMHLTRIISQSLQDNTDLVPSIGECFANISDAVEFSALPTWLQLLVKKELLAPYDSSKINVVSISV